MKILFRDRNQNRSQTVLQRLRLKGREDDLPMLMKVAICEDDPTQAKNVRRMVAEWGETRGQKVIFFPYAGSEAFLTDWMECMDFDLLLLDIDLGGGMNGMELARYIRQRDQGIAIIFITGLSEYMNQGYDVQALHFLVKPVKEDRLRDVLDRAAAAAAEKTEEFLFLETESQAERISVSRILYGEAFSHTVALYLTPEKAGGEISCREAKLCLGDLEERLPGPAFFRCHRSYLVHLPYIRKIEKTQTLLEHGISVPVSRGKRAELYRAFLKYHREEEN